MHSNDTQLMTKLYKLEKDIQQLELIIELQERK